MRTLSTLLAVVVVAACTGPAPTPTAPSLATAPPITPVPTAERPAFDVAIDCGPMEQLACEERVAVLMASQDPALVESITILDEKGSYTMRWTDGDWVTGHVD